MKSYLSIGLLGLLSLSAWGQSKAPAYPPVLERWITQPKQSGIIDFSYAGYQAGATLPKRSQPGERIFRVGDYGAIPNDGKDDIDAIQKAVDAAQAAGGGVVLFPKGTFDFDVSTQNRFVHIRQSNIILRGYGDNIDGTFLHDHRTSHWPNPDEKWLAGTYPSFFLFSSEEPIVKKSYPDTTQLPIEVTSGVRGERTLTVANSGKIRVGNTYLLTLEDPGDSSLLYQMAWPLKKIGKNLAKLKGQDRFKFKQLVEVLAVEGQQVTIAAPLCWYLNPKWKPRLWDLPGQIREVGVENFRLITDWNQPFHHHKNDEHDNGWDGIKMQGVSQGWIRNITFVNVTTAFGLGNCAHVTAYDCRITGNPGHNGYVLAGCSSSNLLMNLQGGTQLHTFGFNGHATGNVLFQCFSEDASAVDTHGGLGIFNLLDNLHGPVLASGGATGNTPPGMGIKLIAWNWVYGDRNPYNLRLKTELVNLRSNPGFVGIGIRTRDGNPLSFRDGEGRLHYETQYSTDWGHIDLLNQTPKPFSLYGYQRKKRLGSLVPTEAGAPVSEQGLFED